MTEPAQIPYPLPRRPRGGQRGNHNAFKHGFYAHSFYAHSFYASAFPHPDADEIAGYTFQGLQEEIAALRLLNRRAIQRAFLHLGDDSAFQDAVRVVIGLTVALNTTLRTQLELDHNGGSSLDAALKQALETVTNEFKLTSPIS